MKKGASFKIDPRYKSFSLVELLAAVAILSILVIVLMGILGSVITTWQEGQAHNERRMVAQTVFNRLSEDLSQAGLSASRNVTNNTLEMVINPSGVSSKYRYPQSLFWQAPVATDGGSNGDMAIVGYFVQWVANGETPGTPALCRVLINPSLPDYGVFTGNPSPWISDSLLAKYAPAAYVSVTATNNYTGLLAANVLGLWMQALDPSGNPIAQGISTPDIKGEAFDSKYSYAYTNYDLPNPYPLETNLASALPASIQIAIAVVDSRTGARLNAKPTYPPLTGSFWPDVQKFYSGLPALVQKGTEIQTITVPLANGPR